MNIIDKICKGNKPAVEFLNLVWQISGVWDDIADGDKVLNPVDIDKAFYNSLVSLPMNQFYQANFSLLNPLLIMAITNWKCANAFEKTDDENKLSIAFILRSSYVDLLTMTAIIVGGREWGDEMVQLIRADAHSETFAGYKANLNTQKASAK